MNEKYAIAIITLAVLALGIIFYSSTTGFAIGVSSKECYDHLDNDGNGYCDFSTKNGYCEDGSILGDPNCDSKKGTETGSCNPSPEVCDGIDNNCNGIIDENLIDTRACGENVGECKAGTETRNCVNGDWNYWSTCQGAIFPKKEICDGKDNNCNGKIDEGCR